MAQLKSTIVTGNLQVTEKAFLGGIKTNVFEAPTASSGTTYGTGSANNVLISNGTSIYWGVAPKVTAANLTTSANAVAYYTDTAGTFGSKASANGALYATTANGALQWGTLPVAQGGTGKTTVVDAANYFLNSLTTGTSTPVDADYYISQYVGGGTTTTTYHRRPVSALWTYIAGKISSVLGISNSSTAIPTAPTATAGTSTTQIATTAFVANAIASVAGPMRFRGSLGTGGTITSLPTAATANQGDTYKVITQGTYASTVAKPGDVFISDGSAWVYIPSGDEPTGTVTSITLAGGAGIDIDDTTALTTSGIRTITNTGVRSITTGSTAGTISVNTGGTLADVAVNGLGNLAFLNTLTFTKADIGLDQVENTALSTWTGNTSISSVGTIDTGTWNASVIPIAKGGTGATSASAAWTALGGGASGTHADNYYALASHGNHVPTTQTANNAVYLRNDNTWHTLVPSDINAAPIASPALTGTPTAPTASAGTNTTQIATTEFVTTAINNIPHSELVHTQSITIAVADWSSSNTCTKTVSGVTSSMIVIVAPAAGSYGVSTTAGVYCTDQGTDTLSFACLFSKPTAAVTINVAMIG